MRWWNKNSYTIMTEKNPKHAGLNFTNYLLRFLSIRQRPLLCTFSFYRKLYSNLCYFYSCGQQEEATILISGLLLRMCHMYVASISLDFRYEWMECTEHNLITRVLTFYHVKLAQSTALEQKHFGLQPLSPALHNLWLLLVY